jgi:hypothetical protein
LTAPQGPGSRFERAGQPCFGGKVRRWGSPRALERAAPGDFLARLWTLFGPPDQVGDDGYSYELVDSVTGLCFSAYSGASGPAYGAKPAEAAALAPVLDAFDALLDATELADCAIEYDSEHGRRRCGATGGIPFDKSVPQPGAVESARAAARAALERQPPDVWVSLNALLELRTAWADLDEPERRRAQEQDRPVAARLWDQAFALVEREVADLAGQPRPDTGKAELLADVALAPLDELAPGVVDPEAYGPRRRAILAALEEIIGPL